MSVYDYVNERLLKAMDKGIIPWQKPWRCAGYRNPLNGEYHGMNIMMAGIHNLVNDFKSPNFFTLNQVKKLGGWVEDIKNYCMIIYFQSIEKKDNPEETFSMLRYYRTYNQEQTNLPADLFKEPENTLTVNPFDLMYGYHDGPVVAYDQKNKAFFNKRIDEVHMPEEGRFFTENGLKSTLFHELIHSTMIEKRLNRKFSYAKEELIADMGAAFMMHECGLEVDYENHAAYIASWAKAVEDDKTIFVSAAGHAEKAVKFIFDKPAVMEKVV